MEQPSNIAEESSIEKAKEIIESSDFQEFKKNLANEIVQKEGLLTSFASFVATDPPRVGQRYMGTSIHDKESVQETKDGSEIIDRYIRKNVKENPLDAFVVDIEWNNEAHPIKNPEKEELRIRAFFDGKSDLGEDINPKKMDMSGFRNLFELNFLPAGKLSEQDTTKLLIDRCVKFYDNAKEELEYCENCIEKDPHSAGSYKYCIKSLKEAKIFFETDTKVLMTLLEEE